MTVQQIIEDRHNRIILSDNLANECYCAPCQIVTGPGEATPGIVFGGIDISTGGARQYLEHAIPLDDYTALLKTPGAFRLSYAQGVHFKEYRLRFSHAGKEISIPVASGKGADGAWTDARARLLTSTQVTLVNTSKSAFGETSRKLIRPYFDLKHLSEKLAAFRDGLEDIPHDAGVLWFGDNPTRRTALDKALYKAIEKCRTAKDLMDKLFKTSNDLGAVFEQYVHYISAAGAVSGTGFSVADLKRAIEALEIRKFDIPSTQAIAWEIVFTVINVGAAILLLFGAFPLGLLDALLILASGIFAVISAMKIIKSYEQAKELHSWYQSSREQLDTISENLDALIKLLAPVQGQLDQAMAQMSDLAVLIMPYGPETRDAEQINMAFRQMSYQAEMAARYRDQIDQSMIGRDPSEIAAAVAETVPFWPSPSPDKDYLVQFGLDWCLRALCRLDPQADKDLFDRICTVAAELGAPQPKLTTGLAHIGLSEFAQSSDQLTRLIKGAAETFADLSAQTQDKMQHAFASAAVQFSPDW